MTTRKPRMIDRDKFEDVFMSIIGKAIRKANAPENVRRYPLRSKAARQREIDAFNLGVTYGMEAFFQAVGDKPRQEPPQRLP